MGLTEGLGEPEIVTLLFTDLVGSTELLGQLGEQGAEALRRTHFDLIREAVAVHRGREVKTLGDGFMVVFASAVDALDCAVAIQRATDSRRRNAGAVPFEVRIGLHLGEPIRHEGDFFGTPVVVASRLCSSAAGGEILTSEVLRSVVGGRGDFVFRSVGPLALKGMSELLPACAVEWRAEALSATEPAAVQSIALPAGLLDPRKATFVGREGELGRLREAWELARAGERQVVFLAGDAGIGKTRLSSELAAEVLAAGGSVLFGRCDEESVVPYQPFVEALRQLPAAWAAALPADQQVDLARLLPDLAGRKIGPSPPAADPETERYRFFEGVAALLAAAARHSPVVLVLDDLHWASHPTVLLLRHVVRSHGRIPLLVVGTYRDVEVSRDHPLSGVLSELRRDGSALRIHLGGLSTVEVRTLLESRAGHAFDRAEMPLYEAVWENAEGNPFFILEINRHLAEAGRLYVQDGRWRIDAKDLDELDLPEGVREVVRRRLARLSESANLVLSTAAVLGRQFTFELVAHMAGLADVAVLAALDEALEARLVLELPAATTTSYSFTHALVRETLLGELSRTRRQWLHLRAAESMEVVWDGRLEGKAAALAGHYGQAGSLAPADKAIGTMLAAGDEAAAALAWEEVTSHWEAALDLMERTGAEAGRRAHLLARLADLFFVAGSDLGRSIQCAEKAVVLYEELDDRQRVAVTRSRLGGYLTTNATYGVMDVPRGLRELREAARVLQSEPESLAYGYVQGSVGAAAGIWAAQLDEGLAASRLAMAIGEAQGHEPLWAMGAMLAGYALSGLGAMDDGLDLMERAWSTADRLDHRYLATRCVHCRTCWTTLVHDPLVTAHWAERELSKRRLAHAPIQRQVVQGQLAWAWAQAGKLAEAQRLVDELLDLPIGVFRPSLELWEGKWQAAENVLLRALDQHRATGNRFDEARALGWIADCRRMRGSWDGSEESYRQVLDVVVPLSHRVLEVHGRVGLGLVALERDRLTEAREQVGRARELTVGESWAGLAGRVELAEAALRAAGGDLSGSEAGFALAVDCFRRRAVPWDEAEALLFWGRALARADDGLRARERMDDALAVYEQIAAAEPWRAKVRAERVLLS